MFGGLKKHHPPVADCVLGNLTIYAILCGFFISFKSTRFVHFFFCHFSKCLIGVQLLVLLLLVQTQQSLEAKFQRKSLISKFLCLTWHHLIISQLLPKDNTPGPEAIRLTAFMMLLALFSVVGGLPAQERRFNIQSVKASDASPSDNSV